MTRSNAGSSFTRSSGTTSKTLLDAAKPVLISAAVAALTKLANSQQAKDGAKAGAAKFADVKDAGKDKAAEAGGTLADAKDAAADKLSAVADTATEKAGSAKDTLLEEVVPRVTEALAGLAASGAVAKEAAQEKFAEAKEAAADRAEEARAATEQAKKRSRKELKAAKKDAKATRADAQAAAFAQFDDAKALSKRQLRKAQQRIADAADNSSAVDRVVTFVEDQSNGKVKLRPEKKGGKGLILLGTLAAAGAVALIVFQQSKPKDDPWATPLADPYTPPTTGRDSTLGGNISTVASDRHDGHTDATTVTPMAAPAATAGAAAGTVPASVTGEGDPLSAVHRVDDEAQPIGDVGEPAATDWQVMAVEDDGSLVPADEVEKPDLDALTGDLSGDEASDDDGHSGRHRDNL